MTNALLSTYSRYPVEFIEGKGCKLFDNNGDEYLDFLSGIAVTGFGHLHPEITKAVNKQLSKLWHVSNLFESTPQQNLASKLITATGLKSVFFCNSGTEANEAAIKFARKWGGKRKKIIVANGSFHGRTMGSLSATGKKELWSGFEPMLQGFTFARFNDVKDIKSKIDEDTCAIMVEPIQGENGIIIPDEKFLTNLEKICTDNNILLILDEVQTGMGRTGKLFAHQWEKVQPDIVTVAKGIANGLPLGAVICSGKIMEIIKPGDHGSTFGGNPVSVAAANTVMDLLNSEMLEYTIEMGEKLIAAILSLNLSSINAVRGKGLMIAIELNEPRANKVALELLREKIIVGTSGNSIIRIYPPFIITENEIRKFINQLKIVIK